ncbi:hypothetical protein [uncultured Bacteroides sp.]|uniref:hypothetical protein n=1 Tax=uncultured Bacteroides sp. TaxID=162156 RepID=UPI0025EF3724|nr:hypothetical protein [uncultured Bacteroides sp.]
MKAAKEYKTEGWVYLSAVTGITSFLSALLGLYFHHWILATILLLITIRQAIVFPKWIKKLKAEKEAKNEEKQ